MPFYPLTGAGIVEAILYFVGFVMLLAAGSLMLPGGVREGALREDGTRQRYKLNGLLLFCLVIGGALAGEWIGLRIDPAATSVSLKRKAG